MVLEIPVALGLPRMCAASDGPFDDRPPRLVALRRPADAAYLHHMRSIWQQGDAVLPLPDDDRAAQRLVTALRPDVVAYADGRVHAADAPREDRPPLPTGTALVVATSGSTGPPRGVLLSHRAVEAAVAASRDRLAMRATDRWLCCLPLMHLAGLLVLLRGDATSRPTLVHGAFHVQDVRAALEDASPPTLVSLVPTMLRRLLEAGVDVAGFRTILLGGAAADRQLVARAAQAGAHVVTTYGMTETCGGVVYDGVPLDGVGVAIEGDGRILLSGPTLLTGYRDGGPPPIEDGWLVTSDHGRWDASGRLDVRGRLDDIIVTGGENVSARSVVDALEQHEDVRNAAVRGIGDPEWGHRVEAWITTDADEVPSLEEIITFVRALLSPAAIPKRLHLVDELPRTALGKVAGAALEDMPVHATWPPSPSA